VRPNPRVQSRCKFDYGQQILNFTRMKTLKLAPLRCYQPEAVVPKSGDSRLHSFLLALSVVFNDLKGLLLFRRALAPLKPADNEVSPAAGEWRGLEIQLQRYTIALVHELLALIKEFQTEAEGPEITASLQSAAPAVRSRWRNLVNVAIGAKTQGDLAFTKVLVQIRNNVASHYHQPKALVAGYRRHFFEKSSSPVNKYAFASLGKNMEHTRFYYADAALQGAISSMTSGVGEETFAKRVRQLGTDINEALERVLSGHLAAAEVPSAEEE